MTEFVEGWLRRECGFLSPLGLGNRYADATVHERHPHTGPITTDEDRAMRAGRGGDVEVATLRTEFDNFFHVLLLGLGLVPSRAAKNPRFGRWSWSRSITRWAGPRPA